MAYSEVSTAMNYNELAQFILSEPKGVYQFHVIPSTSTTLSAGGVEGHVGTLTL